MQTITTKYSPATNTRGSRIIATSTSGERASESYAHELSGAAVHWQAAEKLAKKLNWNGTMQAGNTKDGYVFVFIDSQDQFTIESGDKA
jgi:hypothetical protein